MPAKRLPWFKLWIGCTAHGKVRQLDDGTFRTWVELLDAASQQPTRGRFSSEAEAVAITRRPAKHIRMLVEAGLMDATADGLWLHDWSAWQDVYPSDIPGERSANTPPTLPPTPEQGSPERSAKADPPLSPPTTPPISPRRSEKEKGEGDTPTGVARADEADDVYDYFKATIQPLSRKCPRKRIEARLRAFTAEELKAGIDHFAADWWWMENNASQGADWFFESDQQSERWLLLKPRPPKSNVVPINGRASSGLAEMEAEFGHLVQGGGR